MSGKGEAGEAGTGRKIGAPDRPYLPSPYIPHACGLMHLPRMIEKIRRRQAGVLSAAYERTLGRGFDQLLLDHLGISLERLMTVVAEAEDEAELERRLKRLFPADLRVHEWNRKLVHRGLEGYSLERLKIRKRELHLEDRDDILTMCDLVEVAEERLP